MKATISAVIIIIAVIAACIFTTGYTASVCRNTQSLLEQCAAHAEARDWGAASRFFDAAEARYSESAPLLHTYIPHDALDDVSDSLLRIEAAIALGDTVTCNTEINCLCGYLEQLATTDRLSAANLF